MKCNNCKYYKLPVTYNTKTWDFERVPPENAYIQMCSCNAVLKKMVKVDPCKVYEDTPPWCAYEKIKELEGQGYEV